MWSGQVPLVALPKYLFSGIDLFALEAVPFFILTAELMTGGELSAVLLRFASQFVGRFRGGMGHTNILTLTFFSGISGSALADAAGPGAIMIRMMRDDGYEPEYAAALTAATSILGPIIPPSISVIIYALAYPEVNLVGLLIAGAVPGIVIAVAMAVINHAISVRRNYRGSRQRLQWRDYARNTWRALPALVLPVLILGGIASGAFTPTEASVVAVFYALFAGRVVYRTLEWRMLPGILARSALMTASVLIIVGMSAAFAWVLTVSRVPQDLTEWIVGMQLSPLAFLFAVNLLLLVFGIFIEPLPGIVVLAPILAPIAHALGINDLQFGIVDDRQPDDGDDHAAGRRAAVRDVDRRKSAARTARARAVAVPLGAARRAGAAVARSGAIGVAAGRVRLPLKWGRSCFSRGVRRETTPTPFP